MNTIIDLVQSLNNNNNASFKSHWGCNLAMPLVQRERSRTLAEVCRASFFTPVIELHGQRLQRLFSVEKERHVSVFDCRHAWKLRLVQGATGNVVAQVLGLPHGYRNGVRLKYVCWKAVPHGTYPSGEALMPTLIVGVWYLMDVSKVTTYWKRQGCGWICLQSINFQLRQREALGCSLYSLLDLSPYPSTGFVHFTYIWRESLHLGTNRQSLFLICVHFGWKSTNPAL